MIELVRDLRTINVLAKFENDPWKIMDVRVLTGLVCPAARPPARPPARGTTIPRSLKGCGVKMIEAINWSNDTDHQQALQARFQCIFSCIIPTIYHRYTFKIKFKMRITFPWAQWPKSAFGIICTNTCNSTIIWCGVLLCTKWTTSDHLVISDITSRGLDHWEMFFLKSMTINKDFIK